LKFQQGESGHDIPTFNGLALGGSMEFLQAFPIAIIDEDYEGKRAAGRGMRQLAAAIEKEGFRVVAGLSYTDAQRLVEVFNNESCWLVSIDGALRDPPPMLPSGRHIIWPANSPKWTCPRSAVTHWVETGVFGSLTMAKTTKLSRRPSSPR
jgi:hypothetical protein